MAAGTNWRKVAAIETFQDILGCIASFSQKVQDVASYTYVDLKWGL
jgi:hypothetical protein